MTEGEGRALLIALAEEAKGFAQGLRVLLRSRLRCKAIGWTECLLKSQFLGLSNQTKSFILLKHT